MSESPKLEELAPRQLDRLVARLRGRRPPASAGGRIPCRSREREAWPLSAAQERIWFLERLDPGSATYHVAAAFELRGRLDSRALDRALVATCDRHEILRTRFAIVDGEPVQIPQRRAPSSLLHLDLSALKEEDRDAGRGAWIPALVRRPFDLGSLPLARWVVVRSGALRWLVVVVHHLLADEWSAAVLLRELGELYAGDQRAAQLPLPEVQYLDYAIWQRERIEAGAYAEQSRYWRRKLAGAPASLALPYDRSPGPERSTAGAQVHAAIPPRMVRRLATLARERRASPFMALTAVTKALLFRLTGERDLNLATPVANRGRAELERTIGCFVNTLILRTRWGGELSFTGLLDVVRGTVLEATANQDLPFERLVHELDLPRSLSHAPLAQVMITLETRRVQLELEGIDSERRDLDTGTAKFDLQLAFAPAAGGGLGLTVSYAADLFDRESVETIAVRFVRVLEACLDAPGQALSRLHLLSSAERRQLLEGWAVGRASDAPPPRAPELIARRCREHPERLALWSGEASWTYGELDARVSRLARRLAPLLAGRGRLVAVAMARSPWLVAALLAVHRCGAAYLPLDPAYPERRLRFMLEDSGARILLLDRETLGFGVATDLEAIDVRELSREADTGADRHTPPRASHDERLSHVIYTSGSTGWPKGVGITHAGVARLIEWAASRYSRDELDGVLAGTSVCFDLSVFELFVPLALGGRVVLAEDALSVATLPADADVRLLNTVPSVLAELLRADAVPASVRTVNLAGEPLTRPLVDEIYSRTTVERVLNLYGPSEDTTYSTYAEIDAAASDPPAIGRPLLDTSAYVLDANGELAVPGAIGELCLGGEQLARGYLGRPALTAERFVPDRFSGRSGARLYRTGDRASFSPAGELRFHGRFDQQVKVRGHRIELGEIETALEARPEVLEAAVAVVGGPDRLVAFVALARDEGQAAADGEAGEEAVTRRILASLGTRLPYFMVPSSLVVLAALPRLANGKIDRHALPTERAEGDRTTPWSEPRGATEEAVAEIYAQLLERERVSRDDDFFALGGHSLLAFRLALRLRERFAIEVPLRTLFGESTVARLAAVIDAGEPQSDAEPSPTAGRLARAPLSFEQERLWFLEQLAPPSALYNLPLEVRLEGRLAASDLIAAWRAVLERQTALRTVIVSTDGEAEQRLRGVPPVALPLIDLGALAPADREAVSDRLSRRAARLPFDLERALARLLLLRRTLEDHRLVGAVHHAVADGESVRILMRELGAAFNARRRGVPGPLGELDIDYLDHARWQRRTLSGERLEARLEPWRRRLDGLTPRLDLPFDRPRPARRLPDGEHLPLRLRGLDLDAPSARRRGATDFQLLFTVFLVLLYRLSGERDLAVGTPVANRRHPALEDVVGFFANTVVVRTRLQAGDLFADLLARARESTLFALEHQEVPLAKVVEAVQPGRDLGGSPLFQVMFVLQRALPRPELEGLDARSVPLTTGTSKFDLTLFVEPGEGGLEGLIEYSTQLFDRATAERFAGYFESLLRGALADPERPLDELPMLAPAERRQLLTGWNGARIVELAPAIHRAFLDQAARTPGAVAVQAGEEALTYRQLAEASRRWAAELRRRGIGPGDSVGVSMRRTPRLLVALLGVLRSGAAYLPLDPAYPPARTAFILADADAALVLADTDPPAALGAERWQRVDQGFAPRDLPFEDRPADSEALAYTIYTSGSTGRPKGVAIPHRAAAELVRWGVTSFAGDELERTLASTSVCFDLSIFELFVPLASGGRVVLADDVLALAGERVPAVTTINTVPSAAAELLRLDALPRSVRTVNLAGEALPRGLAEALYRQPGVERVYNLYGPSEDTTYSTFELVPRFEEGEPAIGRPLPNTRALVLGTGFSPLPVGVAGELFLGGRGLARGYHARPARTAEAFVPDPFASRPGERLYRTGDLVRRRADGRLDFLGRRDHQVKVRGFRVELGEIETYLRAVDGVREAAVTHADGERLVAHLVPEDGADRADLVAACRRELERRLPAALVPGATRLHAALPRTPSGKVDRKALAQAEQAAPVLEERTGRAPESPLERRLAELWRRLLGVERLFVEDDFFALGGHSLLATRAKAALRSELGVEVPLDLLFRHPRLGEQAELVGRLLDGAPAREIETLDQAVGERFELSIAQQRIWFLHRLDPSSSAFNIPLVISMRGRLRAAGLQRALDSLLARHEILRAEITPGADGEAEQRIVADARLELEIHDLSGLSEARRAAAAGLRLEESARRPFALDRPPLLRAALLVLGDERHLLALTVHHVVADGWSLQVLVRDLAHLYALHTGAEPEPLPPLPMRYADFVRWQQRRLEGPRLERDLAFWREHLADAGRAVELPTDRARETRSERLGDLVPGRVSSRLPRRLGAALAAFRRRSETTDFMLLLAAFGALLSRLSGDRDLVIGVPVAGRLRSEHENLVGIFLNTLALRFELGEGMSFVDLAAAVKRTATAAFLHQETPFEKVLETLPRRREGGRDPLFRILFNFLSFTRPSLTLDGLSAAEVTAPDVASKFDLTLYVRDDDGVFTLDWVFDRQLFDGRRIETVAAQYEALLVGLLERPDEPVYAPPLRLEGGVLPDPTRSLRGDFALSIVDRWLEHVERDPRAPAVRDAAGELDHGELEARSRALAAALIAGGLERGEVTAIHATRSASLLVAVLGVLRAGGVFAILDADYPDAALVARLDRVRPRAWVSTAGAPRPAGELGLRADAIAPAMRFDLGDEPAADAGDVAPERAVRGDDSAYVAFTSGTTGEPRAILGRERPVAHFLAWQAERFSFGAGERFALLSGLGHDPALRDLLAPLWCGGCLVVPDASRLGEPGWLRGWLRRERITVCHVTPALAQLLTEGPAPDDEELPALAHVFFGGDVLTPRDVLTVERLAPSARCIGLYGATETPQGVAWQEASGAEPGVPIALGRGIEGVQLLVVTPAGRLAGVGELGEICVRTPYLASGYLGDEAETRRRFVANPWSGDSGDRLYRTGDLGRYAPDGRVVFSGRLDDQAKVRGFRVEPREVETAIARDPAVRRAAVIHRPGNDGRGELIAFVVGDDGFDLAAARADLSRLLPSFMLPARWKMLDELPLTANRKVDRRALAELADGEEDDGAVVSAPRTPLEQRLVGLWCEVLGRSAIGVEDDFFALGGHSLLATRLVGRVQRELGVELTLQDFLDHPTPAGMARCVERSEAEAEPLPRIEPRPQELGEPFALTEIQQAYWVGRSGGMELGGVASHRYLEIDSTALDPARLERAWNRLIEHHPMLRAVMLPDGRQQILRRVPRYAIEIVDLDGDAELERRALERMRSRMSHQRLDIESWPLFDLRAARLAHGRHRLLISFDYLIADAWSFRLMLRDLLTLYADPARRLPPLELSFRDYVLAIAEVERSERYRRARDYWRERVKTLPPGPDLALALAPHEVRDQRFERRSFALDAGSWARLKSTASDHGVSASSLLLAAFAEVLGTWSHSPRFSLVLTLFNRLPLHPEVGRVVGDFTTTTLLELERRPGESFAARAARCQRQLWRDLDHRYFSGVEVVREMGRQRGHQARSATPIVFTSTLDLGAVDESEEAPTLPGEVVHSVSQTPQVLLDHQVSEQDGKLYLTWDAVDEAFPAGMLDEMFAAYRRFVERLVEEPASWAQRYAGSLSPVTRAPELEAASERVPDRSLVDLFVARARSKPHRLAVSNRRRSLSYGELDRRSAELASLLVGRGARRGELVAVVMPKGWEQAVATLAVMRAGCAYLPVDPAWPEHRIARVLDQGKVRMALVRPQAKVAQLPAEVAAIEVPDEAGASEPGALPSVGPDDLAYVIFTSGSTGMPKGVAIDHRGAANTCCDINRRFRVGPEDRVFGISALSFDLSVYDLFGAFAAGAAVVLPEPDEAAEPAGWLRAIERAGVSVWNSVPALMELLVDAVEAADRSLPASLRLALLSGDWIPVSLPDRARAIAPRPIEVISLGGATEGSIWSIAYRIESVDPEWSSIPYGRALDGQSMHVLDGELDPCPVHVPGEIYIGGVGVAKGYWQDPARTATRFVPDPAGGGRLYRTGDLGRLGPDGEIEFLGREDAQVKIRGYRIELGEVETVLATHPEVRAAVAVAAGPARGNRRLIAYYVPAGDDREGLPAELRELAASRLPSYMVPEVLVVLDAVPLSANGKVDRSRLPEPGAAPGLETGRYEAPRNEVEEGLAELIEGVLEGQKVGIHDSLFDLGANSVTAIQLISRIRERFEVDLPLQRLFETPTVAQLGEALVEAQSAGAEEEDEEMLALLAELETISDEEALALLEQEASVEEGG